MKKLIFSIVVVLILYNSLSYATTPSISNVSGTVQTGQTLTITGTTMMDENKTNWLSMYQTGTAYGFEGTSYTLDGYDDLPYDPTVTNGTQGYTDSVKLTGSQSAYAHTEILTKTGCGMMHSFDSAASDVYVRFYTRWDANSWPESFIKFLYGVQAYYLEPHPAPYPTYNLPSTMDVIINDSHNTVTPDNFLESGRWYYVEVHWKTSSPAVYTLWMDGKLLYNVSQSASSPMEVMEFGPINMCCQQSGFNFTQYFDNFTISTSRIYPSSKIEISDNSTYGAGTLVWQTPTALGETSIQVTADLTGLGAGPYYLFVTNNRQETSAAYTLGSGATLLTENFDNQSLPYAYDHGWSSGAFDATVRRGTSGYSAKFTWDLGNQTPNYMGTAASRYLITATDQLYVSLYLRFNSDWVGSGQSYHPHFICILSDEDYDSSPYSGLSQNYLNTYIEPHALTAWMINQNDLLTSPNCPYDAACFYTTDASFSLNTWYHIEAWFKMNTAGQSDGVMQMWVDGISVYSNSAVVYRNSEYPNLKWRTINIGPWIGDGSPQTQTMWMDDLVIMDGIPTADTTAPTVTISNPDPSSITSDSLSVTGTASDAVGVSSCKWRLTSAPDGSNGTACTGTTSWSCSASGFSRGTNTLYVGCGDAADNWGSDSMIVNYLPVIQGVSGLGVSFR